MRSKKLSLSLVLFVALALSITAMLSGVGFVAPVDVAVAQTNNAPADWKPTYNGSYYNNINSSKTGLALRSELETLITNTHKTSANSYDNLKWQFNITDADPETGTGMLWFYTGTKVSSYEGSNTDREHVWPKDGGAAFPAKTEAGCDLQHLRPTNPDTNSSRGSLSYDEVQNGTVVKQNDSTSYGNLCYKNGSFFYPGKGYRGATARILFYVQTRWGTKFQLKFVDAAGHSKTIGKISTLLKWHLEEPPTASEIYRNQKAFEIQGNRNPFIDHPEYAAQIYCNDGQSYNSALQKVVVDHGGNYNDTSSKVELEGLTMNVNSLNLAVGGTSTLSVNAIPSNANNSVTWTSDNSNVARVDGSGKVTAVNAGSAVITATSTQNSNIKATATVTVKEVNDIQISGTASKLTYSAGQKFNPAGLSVTAIYSDGTSATLSPSDVQWLDADTGQSVLLVTTTKIKCKYGAIEKTLDITVTVTANPNITKFTNSVAEIEKKTTLQAKFIAIKQALADYNALSSSEKQEMADVYKVLKNHISEYNQAVNNQNAEMDKAANFLAETLVKTMPALLAIAYMVTRKMY